MISDGVWGDFSGCVSPPLEVRIARSAPETGEGRF